MQSIARRAGPWALAGSLVFAAGCATRSADIHPRPTDPAAYAGWTCERLADEIDTVQQRAADVAYAVDARVGNNMIALGVGVTVFWPALLAMRPVGLEADELAMLKGRFEAMRQVSARRGCGADEPALLVAALAQRPLAPGDRLVYEERSGRHGGVHELGMRVAALGSDRIEFALDRDGRVLSQRWHQDLAGNTLSDGTPALVGWQRLLPARLELGQVVAGELSTAQSPAGAARVRGQVVAIGPQRIGERVFDVAVIELFGDAPAAAGEPGASARLDGVMAVDRRSGVLLRLELRCENSRFSLRRRLLRVETASH